jgi:hypothetical protein
MKKSRRIAQGVAATALVFGFGFVAAAYAHPGAASGMDGMHGMGPGMMHGSGGPMAGQQLMTPEERQAFIEKMRSAKTPEERQKLAEANHAEIEKRAKEKGITLPEAHGPHAGFGPHLAAPSAAPTR